MVQFNGLMYNDYVILHWAMYFCDSCMFWENPVYLMLIFCLSIVNAIYIIKENVESHVLITAEDM